MFLKRFLLFVVAPALLLTLLFAGGRVNAATDISGNANSMQPYILGNIVVADTLASVYVSPQYQTITYFINVVSRRHAGFAAGDTVQFRVAVSADDSTFANSSTAGDVVTCTAAGVWPLTFDYSATYPYSRLEVFNMTAADSITVRTKVRIAPRGVR